MEDYTFDTFENFQDSYPHFEETSEVTNNNQDIVFSDVFSAKNYIMHFKLEGTITTDAKILNTVRCDARRKPQNFSVTFHPK